MVRQFVRERLGGSRAETDPFKPLIGDIDDEAGDIDELIYGR